MERRSRSTARRGPMLPNEHSSHSAGPASLGNPGPPILMPHHRQASIGRIPLQELQHSGLHARPGGDSRTLSPDRRPMPKTSPYHSSMMTTNKSGSYNGYTHPPPPPLVPPPNSSSISSASTIAMGVSSSHYNSSGQNYPAPPPRAPVSTSTPQSTPIKVDHHHNKSSINNHNNNNNSRNHQQQPQPQQTQVGLLFRL
jgi:hypothetical protein